jgi:hypothetical protein
MKYEYIRIDMLKVILSNIEHDTENPLNYLRSAPDVEWRDDYQCYFILKGSPTHSWIAMKYGELLD